MRITLLFEDVESGPSRGMIKLSVLPEHQMSAEQLRASPAAMMAKLMVSSYENFVKLMGGHLYEPGEN